MYTLSILVRWVEDGKVPRGTVGNIQRGTIRVNIAIIQPKMLQNRYAKTRKRIDVTKQNPRINWAIIKLHYKLQFLLRKPFKLWWIIFNFLLSHNNLKNSHTASPILQSTLSSYSQTSLKHLYVCLNTSREKVQDVLHCCHLVYARKIPWWKVDFQLFSRDVNE